MIRRSLVIALVLALVLLPGCAKHEAPELWQAIALGSDAEFEDMWFADSLNGWIVGGGPFVDGGIVGRTRDGGRSWTYTSGLATPEPGVSRFSLEAVAFLDSTHGVITSDGGKIFLTDDGGENWRLARYGRGLTDHLSGIDFVDERNGWAVGLLGVVRTRDRGETWETIHRADPYVRDGVGHAIDMLDAYRGWIAGSEGLQYTNDGGLTWSFVSPAGTTTRPHLYDVTFVDASHGWAVGEEGTILHTVDGGATWVAQDTGVADARSQSKPEYIQRRRGVIDTLDLGGRTPALTLTAVRFLDARHGWVAGHYEPGGGRSLLLATDDGGASWQIEAEAPGEALQSLFLLDADHVWAIGDRVRTGTHVVLRRSPPATTSPGVTS